MISDYNYLSNYDKYRNKIKKLIKLTKKYLKHKKKHKKKINCYFLLEVYRRLTYYITIFDGIFDPFNDKYAI